MGRENTPRGTHQSLTLPLRLDLFHHEETGIQKSFDAIGQATLLSPGEPRRGRARDTSTTAIAKHVGDGTVELIKDG